VQGEAKAGHRLWHRALPDEEGLGGAGAVGVRFIGEAPMPREKSTRGMGGLWLAGVASPAWSAGGSQSGECTCGIGPCPMKRALGLRELLGVRFIGEAPMPRGRSTRGMEGLRPAGEAFASRECSGKAKRGTPCGIGPCPMKRALGVLGLEGVRFIGEAPMPRGEGVRGMDGLRPAGNAGGSQSGTLLVASGLAR